MPGLRSGVEVIRDRWGVPHIYAENTGDLFLAQGFVVASERLFQIDLALRAGEGRLSALFAETTLPMDRFARTVGWNRAGRRISQGWGERSREMVSAYLAGVHSWIELMPERPAEYLVLGAEPEVAKGDEGLAAVAAAGVFVAWELSRNWDEELLRTEIAGRLGAGGMEQLMPDSSAETLAFGEPGREGGARRAALELLGQAPHFPAGRGSNAWVVSGSRSATGAPLLANDPHLAVQTPSPWFECHLCSPGYDVSGVALPFSPGVTIGHTARTAWGFTNVGGDTQDLYLERLDTGENAALHEGRWEPLTVLYEEIPVRGRAEPEVAKVKLTRHGPILDSYLVGVATPRPVHGGIYETYALRWVGLEHAASPETVFGLGAATTFEEFREAARGWHCPGQNMVFVSADGTIGYQCTGLYPIRRHGDGTVPAPGWTDGYEWEGFVPFEELPWVKDPEEGAIATANETPHDETYPWLIGKDFSPPSRARRIAQLLRSSHRHSVASFARMQADTVSLPAREIVTHLAETDARTSRHREALALIAAWEGDLAADSVAACIFEVWSAKIAAALLLPTLGPDLFRHYHGLRRGSHTFQSRVLPELLAGRTRGIGPSGEDGRRALVSAALDSALDELAVRLGPDMNGWRWGVLHRVRFAGPLAAVPELAGLFTAGEVAIGGDEQTVCQTMFEPEDGYDAAVVPSWRQIIDTADPDSSVGVHTTGQSGNPASAHWNDQLPLWSGGEYHPLPLTPAAVERLALSTLRLTPG